MAKLIMAIVLLAALLALFGCASTPINKGVDKEGRAYRGADSATLTIYEYSDFECPFCGRAQPTVEQVLRAYPKEIRVEFRNYPLEIHPRAMPSAIAGVCADEQGKFWEMHDKMFANQLALSDTDLAQYAADIGLNASAFQTCIAADEASQKVQQDMLEAAAAGVQATPSFKIGETFVRGAQPFDKFKQAIDSELARAK